MNKQNIGWLIGTLIIVCLGIFLYFWYSGFRSNDAMHRCVATRIALERVRAQLRISADVNSIAHKMFKSDSGKKLCEYISDPNGNPNVSLLFDGAGGWYYDSKAQNIQVNLLRPISAYIKHCPKHLKSQKPSEW